MPTQWNNAAAQMTTSASFSVNPWSLTMFGTTPRLNSSRASRNAMLVTIWMWTHEWSDIPRRRVALTSATCHHAFTRSSSLTASSNCLSFWLPRAGA